MYLHEELYGLLKRTLPLNKARVRLMSLMIEAVLKLQTVNLSKLALILNPKCQPSSNYRRLQRFVANFDLDILLIGKLLYAMLPQKDNLMISIDRTEWKSGSQWMNILMAAVIYNGTAFPIYWSPLATIKNSTTKERTDFMQHLLCIIAPKNIKAILADREFIGDDWFAWLIKQKLPFFIRIKKNALLESASGCCAAKKAFANLRPLESRHLCKPRDVYQQRLWLSGMKLQKNYLIVASNVQDPDALQYYKERWAIETLFLNLKSRGFDMESTHLREPKRIAQIIAILSLAYSWASLVGLWRNDSEAIKRKKHGRKAQSFFRYGLDLLQRMMLTPVSVIVRRLLRPCIRLLQQRLAGSQLNTT